MGNVLEMVLGRPDTVQVVDINLLHLLDSLQRPDVVQGGAASVMDAVLAGDPAVRSTDPSDLQRILDLPIVDPSKTPDLTESFREPGGTMVLRPIQNAVLWQASQVGGLLGVLGVGHGKTICGFLLPRIMGAKRPLLLIPASMREQCEADYLRYGEHFKLADPLTVRTYEELSSPSRSGMLRVLNPDLIVADEGHRLRATNSTRYRRLRRYIQENPETRFCVLSGTITAGSLKDFWHLSRWALRAGSPLPLTFPLLQAWCDAVDAADSDAFAGRDIAPLCRKFNTTSPRDAVRARLVSAPGVAATSDQGVSASLLMVPIQVMIPAVVKEVMREVEETWQAPNGDELEDNFEKSRVMRQLICGFYYYWDWSPVPWEGKPDKEWLGTRSAWHKAVRETLQSRFTVEGLDSPILLARACARRLPNLPPKLMAAWEAWIPHRTKRVPPTLAAWIDPYLVTNAAAWVAKQEDPPLVWYGHRVFGQALAVATGVIHFGDEPDAARAIAMVEKAVPAIVSIAAHGGGRNMQTWGCQLVATPLSNGARFEQLIGRTHRSGQLRDEVVVTTYVHGAFKEALQKAFRDAQYIEATTGQRQRLCYASKSGILLDIWDNDNNENED